MKALSILLLAASMSSMALADTTQISVLEERFFEPNAAVLLKVLRHTPARPPAVPQSEEDFDNPSGNDIGTRAVWMGLTPINEQGAWNVQGRWGSDFYSPQSWMDVTARISSGTLTFSTGGFTTIDLRHDKVIANKDRCLDWASRGSAAVFVGVKVDLKNSSTTPFQAGMDLSYEQTDPVSGRVKPVYLSSKYGTKIGSTLTFETDSFALSREFCEAVDGLKVGLSISGLQEVGIERITYSIKSPF